MEKYLVRRIINKLTLGYYKRFRSFLKRLVKDEILYDINTDIGYNLYFYGKFESIELDFLQKFIQPDSVIIDVGANIGYHSIYFAKLASDGLVISIEPSLDVYEILIKNVKEYKNVIPINIAVHDKYGISNFYVTEDNAYSSLKDTKRKKIIKIDRVLTFPLDHFIYVLTRLDLIKIDVEGTEKAVIQSGIKLIEKYKPVIFMEIYKGLNSNDDPEGTIKILVDLGYRVYKFINGKLCEYNNKHDDNYYNYIFLFEGKHELPNL